MLSRASALLRQKSLEASLPCKQGGAQGRTREGFESLPEVHQGSNDNSLSSLKHAGAGDFACESGNCGTFMNRHIINGLYVMPPDLDKLCCQGEVAAAGKGQSK